MSDSKRNLQEMLRRRYQQSRGSGSSSNNSSPNLEPVSFRPPAQREQKKMNTTPPGGASGGMASNSTDANGNIIFDNNFDSLPPQNEAPHKGQMPFQGQGKLRSQGQGPNQQNGKGHHQGQRSQRQTKSGQYDAALSTVIGEISSGGGARSKQPPQQSENDLVFENDFDDVDQMSGAAAGGQQQLPKERNSHRASSMGKDPAQAAREREERLQRLRRPRELTEDFDNPLATLANMTVPENNLFSANQDADGDQKMDRKPKAQRGRAARSQFDEDQLLRSLTSKGRKKADSNHDENQMNELMQSMRSGGGKKDKPKDPLSKMKGKDGGDVGVGGMDDEDDEEPLAKMMNHLGGMGGGGGNAGGGNNQMAQLMGGGARRGGRAPGADPLSQMLAGLGAGGGQENPFAQIMSMMGGGGQGGEEAMNPLAQMMAGMGGGGRGGSMDAMAQMLGMMGGGGRGGGGPMDAMAQMMGAMGGGGRGGGGSMDALAQMMGGMGGGGSMDALAPMMGGMGGGGRGGGGSMDAMAQMMGGMGGGVRRRGSGSPMDPMARMREAVGGGMGTGQRLPAPPDPSMGQFGGRGRGRAGNQEEENEIDFDNASLNDQIQQLLGYENLKARNNRATVSDGMCTILIVDTSGSMHGDSLLEVGHFISQFLNGLEEVQFEYGLDENIAIICAGREVHVLQHLTTDYTAVRRAVDTIYADGPSPLHLGLMLPLSVLVLDPQQGRDYIAQTNGHHIRPRIIVISDGHPTTREDTPGVSAAVDPEESVSVQEICVELLQTVREKTLCEVICIPVGDANMDFLEHLAASVGGSLMQTVDAKQMSRTYLHHFVVGNLLSSRNDTSSRETVAALVQQCLACSDEADVTAVMRILEEGELDLEARNQTLVAEMERGNQGGRGRGDGMSGEQQEMMQLLMSRGRGGPRGGPPMVGRMSAGRGQHPMMGRPGGNMGGQPPMMGKPGGNMGGQSPMMGKPGGNIGGQPTMMGKPGGNMGVQPTTMGKPGGNMGGQSPMMGRPGGNMAAMMGGMGQGNKQQHGGQKGQGKGQQDGEDALMEATMNELRDQSQDQQGPRGDQDILMDEFGSGGGARGGSEIRMFGQRGKRGNHEFKILGADGPQSGNINENFGPPMTEEEMSDLLSKDKNEDDDDDDDSGSSDDENDPLIKELMGILPPQTNSKNKKKAVHYWDQMSGRKPVTEEEKRKDRFQRMICAERMGISSSDEEKNDNDAVRSRDIEDGDEEEDEPDAAEQDIDRRLMEIARKKEAQKKSRDGTRKEKKPKKKKRERSEPVDIGGMRQQLGDQRQPAQRGMPNIGRGGFPMDFMGASRMSNSPPKHNLPPDIAAMMKLDQIPGQPKIPKKNVDENQPPPVRDGVFYQQEEGGARSRNNHGANREQKVPRQDDADHLDFGVSASGGRVQGVDDVESVKRDKGDDDFDASKEHSGKPQRVTNQEEQGSAQAAAGSRGPRRPSQNRALREMLLQRQQRNPRRQRQVQGQQYRKPDVDEDSDTVD